MLSSQKEMILIQCTCMYDEWRVSPDAVLKEKMKYRGLCIISSTNGELRADSLPAEPPGKLKNTGGGSLSLLQWILLPHCRQILYQLSYQESPFSSLLQYLQRMIKSFFFSCYNFSKSLYMM